MSWKEITINKGLRIKHGYAFDSKYFTEDNTSQHIVLTPGNFH
jgi:hypothetical protein